MKNSKQALGTGMGMLAYLALASIGHADQVTVTGRITSGPDRGISGCRIALAGQSSISILSDSQGRFVLRGETSVGLSRLPSGVAGLDMVDGKLFYRVDGKAYIMDWNETSGFGLARMGPDAALGKQSSIAGQTPTVEILCNGFEKQTLSLQGYTQDLGTLLAKAIDNCPNDPAKTNPGACGCGLPEDACGGIQRIGTTAEWDENGENISIGVPSGTKAKDLMLLVLHRTDDFLPLKVNGWTKAAECYKTDNGFNCAYESTCKSWVSGQNAFCQEFNTGAGRDLAQAIYYKEAAANEPGSYNFNLNYDGSGHPGWIFLTTFRGAATSNPIRAWAGVGNDGSPYSKFPSVNGQAGDMLVLSQSFDDFVPQSAFTAPVGMEDWGYVGKSDETGFLFGAVLTASGPTGVRTSRGPGASDAKDGLISLTIMPRPRL